MNVRELKELLLHCPDNMSVVIAAPVQGDCENIEPAERDTFYRDLRYNNLVIFP